MAWGRKKSGGRKEPLFGLAASLSELRLNPQDRVASDDEKPKKPSAKRRAADPDDEAPPERKPRVSRSGKRRSKARGRGGLYRLFWHAPLARFSLFVCLFCGGALAVSSH